MLKQINSKKLVALFFCLLTLIGILTIQDYGSPYDELTELIILGANIKEYALIASGDENTNYYTNMSPLRIRDNIERDHGICGYYPLAPLFPQMEGNFRLSAFVFSLLTWLWFMLGCFSLYCCLRYLNISRVISCLGVLLLYLCPRFFAEGHYNNKDVVLLCFYLFTFWQGAKLIKKQTYLNGILFSLAGAMATNTKIVGILPWGLVGLGLIIYLSVNKYWTKRKVIIAIVTIISFVVFYFLLTPAMWSNPIDFIQHLLNNAVSFSRFGGSVIFRGANFYDVSNTTPLPFYYVPYYILVTIPLFMLFLIAVGQFFALFTGYKEKNIWKTPHKWLLFIFSASYLIPLIYSIISTPILYNGWRHFYFLYAGLVVMGGYGIQKIWELVQKKNKLRFLAIISLSLCFIFTITGLIQNRHYQFCYYNPIIKRDAKHTMDMDYWNVAPAGAFRELYALKKDEGVPLKVGCYFNDIAIGQSKLPKEIDDAIIVTVEKDEDYLYYGATYAYIYFAKEPPEGYKVLKTIKSYGNTIGTLYEKIPEV